METKKSAIKKKQFKTETATEIKKSDNNTAPQNKNFWIVAPKNNIINKNFNKYLVSCQKKTEQNKTETIIDKNLDLCLRGNPNQNKISETRERTIKTCPKSVENDNSGEQTTEETENVEKTDNQTVAQNKNPWLNVKKKKNKKTAWKNITQNIIVPKKAYEVPNKACEVIKNFDEDARLPGKTPFT